MPDSSTSDPLAVLAAQVKAAKEAAENNDGVVTIADVAAAAFVGLETLVNLLGPEKGQQVINEFETRAAMYAVSFEEGDGA